MEQICVTNVKKNAQTNEPLSYLRNHPR